MSEECVVKEGIASLDSSENAQKVVEHYNTIEEKGLSHRNRSRILHLRNFNNWIKSVILKEYLELISQGMKWASPLKVIDLGCGKGGDLAKWLRGNSTHIVFADIAENSISDCRNRFDNLRSNRNRRPTAEFIVADLTKERLRRKLRDPSLEVDLTSCQFALHYGFESLQQAEIFLLNASDCLRTGGYFVGTIPDAAAILARARANGGREFGNDVCNVKLEFDSTGTNPPPLFGAKYNFHLEGVVDCPEFLVHFPTLVRLANKYGMELVEKKTFAEYFKDHLKQQKFLLQRMSGLETYPGENLVWDKHSYTEAQTFIKENPAVGTVGTLSQQEWEVASLYLVFAFKKAYKVSQTKDY